MISRKMKQNLALVVVIITMLPATLTANFDDFSVTGNDVPDILSSVLPKDKLVTKWGEIKTDH
jgi:hypothetical protein